MIRVSISIFLPRFVAFFVVVNSKQLETIWNNEVNLKQWNNENPNIDREIHIEYLEPYRV